jgi:hypothetical protein
LRKGNFTRRQAQDTPAGGEYGIWQISGRRFEVKKKPFVLGDDVARALAEIISINDDLPEEYRRKVEQVKGEKE